MTNYEYITSPSIVDLAEERTRMLPYSKTITYVNDAGTFCELEYGGTTYDVAIKEEIKWLRSDRLYSQLN